MTGPADGGFADPIQAPGTPEAEWQAWPGWAAFRKQPWDLSTV